MEDRIAVPDMTPSVSLHHKSKRRIRNIAQTHGAEVPNHDAADLAGYDDLILSRVVGFVGRWPRDRWQCETEKEAKDDVSSHGRIV
jgi:hypothetical protein